MLTLTEKILSFNGFNFIKVDWKPSIWSWFNFITFFFYPLLIVYNYLNKENSSLTSLIVWFSTLGSAIQIEFKYTIMLMHRNNWLDLIGTVEDQRRQDAKHTTECGDIVADYSRKFNFSIKFLYTLYILTLLMFSAFPLLQSEPYQTPLSLDMPFWRGDTVPFWQFNFLINMWMIFVAANFIIAMDAITFYMLLHACCRCDIMMVLLLKLDNEINESSEGIPDRDREMIVEAQMKDIIKIHIETKTFMATVERNFAFSLLIHFFSATILICMNLTIIASDLMNSSYVFFMACLAQTFIYCFFGNHLSVKNANLITAIYDINWHKMSKKNQKNLRYLLEGAQRPLQLTSIFLPLNLQSFLRILKASYSYFALLNSIEK